MSGRPAPVLRPAGRIAAVAVAAGLLFVHSGPTRSAEPEPAANASAQRGQELADANGCVGCPKSRGRTASSSRTREASRAPLTAWRVLAAACTAQAIEPDDLLVGGVPVGLGSMGDLDHVDAVDEPPHRAEG